MREAYCHATLVTTEGITNDASFFVEDGLFAKVCSGGSEGIDLQGAYVLPGFIDSHIHGFGSYNFENPGCNFDAAAKALRRFGVTSFLPTVCPALLPEKNRVSSAWDNPAILGFHLEGPFLNPARKGGFSADQILPYTPQLAQAFFSRFEGRARIMTAAPEMVSLSEIGDLARTWGVRLSAGHTQADLQTAKAAFLSGFAAMTHFYNAMPSHHHRSPTIWDEAMLNDQVALEVIADLHHLSAESLSLLLRCKGAKRLIAVTDSVCIQGEGFEVRDGLVYKDGIIYGSQCTMQDMFLNLVRVLKVSLPDAVSMTSSNIAKALALPLGDIKEGYRADFLVMDNNLRLKAIYTGMHLDYCA